MESFELVLWLVVQLEFLRYEITLDNMDDIKELLSKRDVAKTIRLVNRRLNKLIISNARFEFVMSQNTKEAIGYLPAFPGPNIYFTAHSRTIAEMTHNNLITYVYSNHPRFHQDRPYNPRAILGMNIYDAMVKYNEDHMSIFSKIFRWMLAVWYTLLYTWHYQKEHIVFPILYQLAFIIAWYCNLGGIYMFVVANVWLFLSIRLGVYYIPSCGHIHRSVQVIDALPPVLECCIASR